MIPVKTAGFAAIGAAVTYLVGFVVLLMVLIPAGYNFAPGAEVEAIALLRHHAGMMTAWNSVVYIANAVLVGVLVIALYEKYAPLSLRLMRVASAFGLATLIWFLVLNLFLLRSEIDWAAPDLAQS
ncbi:MAG: hypothetical protein ABJH07_09755 [Sedimentitalea sp.]|uniref:hypothetical protein n=1 Tax=Sedimentitalea sp. TaxID=2048915 RepID=UPI0032636A88